MFILNQFHVFWGVKPAAFSEAYSAAIIQRIAAEIATIFEMLKKWMV